MKLLLNPCHQLPKSVSALCSKLGKYTYWFYTGADKRGNMRLQLRIGYSSANLRPPSITSPTKRAIPLRPQAALGQDQRQHLWVHYPPCARACLCPGTQGSQVGHPLLAQPSKASIWLLARTVALSPPACIAAQADTTFAL